MLKKIEIQNYKSLHNISIDLPPFSVMVGPNAAGKSNFADAIEFIAGAVKNGLPSSVNDKGGYENICFRRARRARGAIKFFMNASDISFNVSKKREVELQFDFGFAFRAVERTITSEYYIESEYLRAAVRPLREKEGWQELVRYEYLHGKGTKVWVNESNKFYPLLVPPEDFLKEVFKEEKDISKDDLLLVSKLRGLPPFMLLLHYLSNLRVFQIMPSRAREPASASGTQEMSKLGDNLPAALYFFQRENPKEYKILLENLRLAVPTVEKLETDYVETRELGLFLREIGMTRRMYASELSDGTLRTIALFVPIVDDRYKLVVIEEPENCIHPWVTRQFIKVCRERSESIQIILTTHSPVLVAQLSPDELFIVERKNGQTQIKLATEVDTEVREIIKGGITNLGDYWDSGALNAVPIQLPLFDNEK